MSYDFLSVSTFILTNNLSSITNALLYPSLQYNPIKTIKTSTEGTLNMLGLAKRVKVGECV